MNKHMPVHSAQRLVLLFLAVAFAGMTLVSLGQRIMRPDLVVPAEVRQASARGNEAPAEDRGEIGRLMQHIRQNPGDVAALVHLAEHLMEEKNWEAAENFSRKAVVAAPGNPQPLYLLGVILHNRGEYAEAAACLERVVGLRDEPSVRYSLGVLYVHFLQNPARGGEHLRAALAQPGLSGDLARLIQVELDALASGAASPQGAAASPGTAPEKKGAKPSPAP